MAVKFYNTLSRKKEEFKPVKPGEVGIYSCGPTVYWNQHIGHMYAYIQWDVMVRFFRFLGFKAKWVMNITDVGHMTSDQDTGEDKMEKGARREGLTVWQIAEKYTNQFLSSLRQLNIVLPDELARVTEHIPEQINLIKKIETNGFTYRTKTGLVFDTGKFPDYAKFGRRQLEDQQAGSRVEVDPEKKKPWDFLLWVTNQPKHVMQWDSPWGRGFPGWHIECTAISTKYLGENFDIHTGGMEHISVHHTNEIAQAFGAFGCQTANFWLHNGWLRLKKEKMSKSKGKMYTVDDLVTKGYDPLALRYLVLTSHYRKGLEFTWEALDAAASALKNLRHLARGLRANRRDNMATTSDALNRSQNYREKFASALGDDLKVPEALAVVWETVKSPVNAYEKYELLSDFDQVLGLKLDQLPDEPTTYKVPVDVTNLAEKREILRKQKDWAAADELRQQIEKMGWQIKDTSAGSKLKPLD